MSVYNKVSTGLTGFDKVIDLLRLGDNVVWQVDHVSDYAKIVEPYVTQARLDNRRLVYVRFGKHKPVVSKKQGAVVYHVDPSKGFESFAIEIYNLVKREGRKVFYVFDCLSDLLDHWHSDLMIGNFFKVTCPYLYELDTVAYFAISRNVHPFATIASIRETTQLLLDLYMVNSNLYIHPLKVWQRYSSTMFFPHLIEGQEAVSITASAEVAALFAGIDRGGDRLDYWNNVFTRAREMLSQPLDAQETVKRDLMLMLIGGESRMFELCVRYFTLSDILQIASRAVGTGFIGGKSVGMLLARKILEKDGKDRFAHFMEPHDSFYLCSDIFYTYIVQNGWWRLRTEQKTPEGYYTFAPDLKEKLLHGTFPKDIKEQFVQMLEYFGQSPIIVRSSSLLEDNFGNAFAGKYESVFCANQGTPEERYEAFEQAVRVVYASAMDEEALTYRMNRGLFDKDEQMAILVQRVSGDQHGKDFFPHMAGVGNSSNLYVWDKSVDMSAGMLRLVFGLGTRAVDRTVDDYAKIVCLDDPLRLPPTHPEDRQRYSQHSADLLSLSENILTERPLEDIFTSDIKTDKALFASKDAAEESRLRELGYSSDQVPLQFDFKNVLKNTEFPALMKDILAQLSRVYDYPVDIEFTANFTREKQFHVNLLQCRPLQTKGLGQKVDIPTLIDDRTCLFRTNGHFMGGNVRLPVAYTVYIKPQAYLRLPEQEKYSVARQVGLINSALKGKNTLLIGPGRWGTTTPSLGVPVHFAELCHMSVICELSSAGEGFMPELSYGSHFFQDLVESGIFYAAIFDGQEGVVFNPGILLEMKNALPDLLPQSGAFADVIHVAKTEGM
jgi:hypothetical protein